MTELSPGQVTIADLYRELTGMRTDVARALERIAVIDARSADDGRLHADHEGRLRTLEAFRWKLLGLALAISVVTGFLAAWLPGHLR